ncbi:unnamed protein product, partial [Strongylus vulgaris]
MYFLSFQDPTAHKLPFCKRFPKTIQPRIVHRALLHAIQKHEMLRTIFLEANGDPRQMVVSMTEAYVPLCIEFSEDLRKSIAERMECPMQLHGRPLVEAIMYETQDCFLAMLGLQHIISDAWSTGILEKEIVNFILDLEKGKVPNTQRQKYTYLTYCKEKMAKKDISEVYIRKLADVQTIEMRDPGGVVSVFWFDFPKRIASEWETGHRVSLFVILLSLLSESVMEQFKLSKINIGCPTANRSVKTKSVFGYFLNNIVIHIWRPRSGENLFRMVEKHIKDVLEQNIPFTELAAQFQKLNETPQPIFQVYFNCRYDLEYNVNESDDLNTLLPIRSEFPIEVDLDKRSTGFRITLRIQDCIPTVAGKELMDRLHKKILSTE